MRTLPLPLPRSRALRYGVPLVLAAVMIGAGPALSAVTADAHGSLPPRSAAQLLADVQQAEVEGVSGTVVETADLGLPALPAIGGAGGNGADFTSLISGSHTMRVWYGGPGRLRVALLGRLGESDLYRNGSDLWAWSSHDDTATRWPAPSGESGPGGRMLAGQPGLALTPQQAAQAALAALSPSTRVVTDPTAVVAGRAAYELDLLPRDSRSLVGSVRIAIDGTAHIPTRVQVFARGASHPAFEIGFTSLSTKAPDDSVFDFTPPPGATVKQGTSALAEQSGEGSRATMDPPQLVGKGWTSVVIAELPAGVLAGAAQGGDDSTGKALLRSLPAVSGSWGSGRLLRTALITAVLTDDGRIAVGAVPPSMLYDALARG
jgi:outer membrane lipoprotein-sorting protein